MCILKYGGQEIPLGKDISYRAQKSFEEVDRPPLLFKDVMAQCVRKSPANNLAGLVFILIELIAHVSLCRKKQRALLRTVLA
jgi:hypothetical protein